MPDGAVNQGFPGYNASIIYKVAGTEVIGAIHYYIVGTDEFQRISGSEPGIMYYVCHFRVLQL